MIAFVPEPPDSSGAGCRYCDEFSRGQILSATPWDKVLGRFTTVEREDDGTLVEGSSSRSAISHLYCHLSHGSGGAAVRVGFADAEIALFLDESWDVYTMNDRGLVPLCLECRRPIASSEERSLVNRENLVSSGPSNYYTHTECTSACQSCSQRVCVSQVHRTTRVTEESPYWEGCSGCFANMLNSGKIRCCHWCGGDYLDSEIFVADSGHITCNHCEDDIYTCDDCGDLYDRRRGNHYHKVVMDYCDKPRAKFYPDGNQPYYLGYELEVEIPEEDDKYEHAEALLRQVNGSVVNHKYLYLKEDGSLDGGFEIVTHPFTLEFHQQFDFSFLQSLMNAGATSWDTETCGFHVHISRSAFHAFTQDGRIRYSKAHELRFHTLMYSNRDYFEQFAGRVSEHYAPFSPEDDYDWKLPEHMRRKVNKQERSRFQAINITNEKTIEVRIFRGTLSKERVLGNLEMVHACVEYTRNLNESVAKKLNHAGPNAYDWNKFRSWITANESHYPNLNKTLARASL